MTIKVNLEELQSKTGKEIHQMMKDGEIGQIPKDQRSDFMKFSLLNPDSQERADMISAQNPPDGDKGVPPSADDTNVPPVGTDEGTATGDKIPAPDTSDADTNTEGDKGEGDSSDAEESYKQMMADLAKKDIENNKNRAKAGQLGRELQEQKKKTELLAQQLAESNKKNPEPTGLVAPILPNPDNFADGMYDEGYSEAMKKYGTDSQAYMVEATKQSSENIPEWAKDLKAKADSNANFIQTEQETKQKTAQEQAWDNLWSDTAQFQKDYGVETAVPIKTINAYSEALKSDDAETRAQGEAFMSKLSETDLAAYNKLTPAINAIFQFDGDNVPSRRYKSTQAALLENNLVDQFQAGTTKIVPTEAERIEALKKKQDAAAGAASGMSGSDIGAADPLLNTEQTQQQKETRVRELIAIKRKNPRSFIASEMNNELEKLAGEMGLRHARR